MVKKIQVDNPNSWPMGFTGQRNDEILELCWEVENEAVFGLGERFNCVNLKGREITARVFEKFCEQGDNSYFPVPFFFTNSGHGMYVHTKRVVKFDFGDKITVRLACGLQDVLPEIYIFEGSIPEILRDYMQLTGIPKSVPKWSFGVWMSANRWRKEADIFEQLQEYEKAGLPANVLVIEAWSDRATFYRWNENGEWKNPEKMIQSLHEKGIRVILWQVPVLKKLEAGRRHLIHEADWNYAVENRLCVFNDDGTPYTIPEGRWFGGSLIPDFTNPKTIDWWFGKRRYLLDMGIDGFKTDGGEFVYSDDICFYDGSTGKEMKNGYVQSYVKAYTDFIGSDRVLFSRAGYTGQQQYPIQWAGDQKSTWEELRSVLKAGLSCGLSGTPLWGFDLAGFAGPMPSLELYERATQMAVFTPIMQWHSEPVGGQFAALMPSKELINDRSPWNMARYYSDDGLIERLRFHYNLRMNLIPYIYDQMLKTQKSGLPMMKHLVVDYPEDTQVYSQEECFMLGDLLVFPVVWEGIFEKTIYLPKGNWYSLWSGQKYEGEKYYLISLDKNRIPVFVREGGCIALNLAEEMQLGSYVGNSMDEYKNLCFWLVGNSGSYCFEDDLGNSIDLVWEHKKVKAESVSGREDFKIFFWPELNEEK